MVGGLAAALLRTTHSKSSAAATPHQALTAGAADPKCFAGFEPSDIHAVAFGMAAATRTIQTAQNVASGLSIVELEVDAALIERKATVRMFAFLPPACSS